MTKAIPGRFSAWRRLVPWLSALAIAGLLAFFTWQHTGEASTTIRSIREARPIWLLVVAGLAIAIESSLVATHYLLLRKLGHKVGWRDVAQAYTQRVAIGTLSPVPGPGHVAFTTYLRRRGVPAGDAVLTLALNSLTGNLSFVLFLVPVLILLVAEGQASAAVLGGAAVLGVLVLLFTVASMFVLRSSGPPAWLNKRIPHRLVSALEEARQHNLRAGDFGVVFGISLGVDLAGAAMLGAALLATGHSPAVSTIVAAYAVATLFTLVAPFFAGAGFVEVGTVVVLRSLNVPAHQAVAATILFRLGQMWLPFLFSLSLSVGTHAQVRKSSYRVPALVTFASGLLGIASVLAPATHHMRSLHPYEGLGVPALSRSIVLVSGFSLLHLSTQLWQRKRTAWLLACLVLAVTIPAHLLREHDRAGAMLYGATLALLVINGRRFNVHGYIPAFRRALRESIGAVSALLCYGTAGFFFLDERVFGREFGLLDAATRTIHTVVLLGDSGLTPRTNYGFWFLDSLQMTGVLAAVFVAYVLGRPVVARNRPREADRLRAEAIITSHGDSSLDFFKYAKDKQFFFGKDGASVVSYGVYRGTAISLGDPVSASTEGFSSVLGEFLAFCERNGWRPAFHQVSLAHLPEYAAAKLKWMKVGEDAVVDLQRFTVSGKSMKHVRSTLNRLEREGYRCVFIEPPLDDEMLEALNEVSDQWLTLGHHRERKFTLGRFEDDYIRNCPVFVVENSESEVVAFANIIPDGTPGEATIDLMRRKPEPDGAMDLLFVRAFERLRDQGYLRFSLGLAPFANMAGDGEATIPEKVAAQLYEHGEALFAYKGLRSYKDKLGPTWEPRYLVYQNDIALPFVTLALARLGD